jgi:hypothetical protein
MPLHPSILSGFALLAATAISLAASGATSGTAQTILVLNSQRGDYIGGGVFQTYKPANGTFSVQSSTGNINASFNSSGHFWWLDFGTANGQAFAPGLYESAQRDAFRSATKPGLDVSGDGRGCDGDSGRFLVSEYVVDAGGVVKKLAIDFEQHCGGASPALYGSLRYHSSVPLTPQLSIANATALKGNAGTSDASPIASLSMPSSQVVTAHYATADGTALHGRDYIATQGTVTFQPGVTAQAITVPIFGNGVARGSRSFSIALQSPAGAPLGQASGSVQLYDPNGPLTVLTMNSQPGDYIGLA